MSDDEESKKSGYRLEVSANNRAACKGPKPCTGTKILKGEVRLGSLVDFRGHTTWSWKHWGCASKKVIENMKKKHPDPEDIDGYEYLNPTQQAKIRTAWETGHVADEDIPPSARKPEGEGGDEEEEEEEEETGKKKKKKAPAKKRTAKQDEDGAGDTGEAELPKKRKKPSKAKGSDDEEVPSKPSAKRKKADGSSKGKTKKKASKTTASDEDE